MTDINERYAKREKLANWGALFNKVGDKSIAQIVTDPVEMPCHAFVAGQKGEALFFQNNRPVPQSALNLSMPHEPITQWVFDVQLKDGTRYTAWMDKYKKKALIAAIRSGQPCLKGGMIAMELTELVEVGTTVPRKLYEIQLKTPKGGE